MATKKYFKKSLMEAIDQGVCGLGCKEGEGFITREEYLSYKRRLEVVKEIVADWCQQNGVK